MKHARWVSCSLFCPVLAAGLVTAHAASAPPDTPQAVRITRADVRATPGRGFTPPPYALAAQADAGPWNSVTLPDAEPPQVPPAPPQELPATLEVWYRMAVPTLAADAGPLYLYLPRWKTDGQIALYGDGRLLYQSHANRLWNGSNQPLWVPLNETSGTPPVRSVQIRIQRLRGTGGGISSAWIGTEHALGWRYQLRSWLQAGLPAMSSAAFLAAGLFALGVWTWRRRESLYLLFFAMSVVSYVRTLHYFVGRERLLLSDAWFGWITVSSLFWLILTAHLFLERLHGQRRLWLSVLAWSVTLLVSLITLPGVSALPEATTLAPLVYVVLLALGLTVFVCAWRSARRAGSHEALLLAGWSIASMAAGGYDWLLQNNLLVSVEGAFLGAYANIGAFFIFSYIMLRRYLTAIGGMEQLNTRLEQRLQEREQELALSYERLRESEHRQTLVRERQRLMQDMHDGLGSSLMSTLRVVRHGQIGSEAVAQMLEECMDDLKLAIDSMEPVDADLLLLLATLRFRLAPRIEAMGVALHWEVQDVAPLPWLDPRSALHLLRILQECFANVLKHAQASVIHVESETVADGVEVRIVDNGQGFDVESALRSGGRGLKNQLRRAEAIGARLAWHRRESGTRCVLWLPAGSSTATAR